ncbi:unnamed protein product [Arctogadus glacialis]
MVPVLIFATTEKSFRSSGQTSSMTQGNPPCEVHRLCREVFRIDRCCLCCSPMSSIRWQGLRCKECRRVWHKSCLLKASEDWDMSESDVSSGEHYNPNNSSESSDAESESDAESKTPPDVDEDALRVAVAEEPSTYICDSMTAPMQDAKETNADSDEHDGSHGKRKLKSQINYCFICKKPQNLLGT